MRPIEPGCVCRIVQEDAGNSVVAQNIGKIVTVIDRAPPLVDLVMAGKTMWHVRPMASMLFNWLGQPIPQAFIGERCLVRLDDDPDAAAEPRVAELEVEHAP